MQSEILKLKEENLVLKKENEILSQSSNKELYKSIKIDETVKQFKKTLHEKNNLIHKLRGDKNDLITKILQLEKKNN